MAPTDHETEVVAPAEVPEGLPLPSDPKVIFLGGLFVIALLTTAYVASERANVSESSQSGTFVLRAVPVHPKKVSIGRALKRPITERRVTTAIMTVMIGTATMPL